MAIVSRRARGQGSRSGRLTLNGATPVQVICGGCEVGDEWAVSLVKVTNNGTASPTDLIVAASEGSFTVVGTALDTSIYAWRWNPGS